MLKEELIQKIDIKDVRRVISDLQGEAPERFEEMKKYASNHNTADDSQAYRDIQTIGDDTVNGYIYESDDGGVAIVGDAFVEDTLLSTATDYDDGFGYYHEYYSGSKQLHAVATFWLEVDGEDIYSVSTDIVRSGFDLDLTKTSAKVKSLIIDMINKEFKES